MPKKISHISDVPNYAQEKTREDALDKVLLGPDGEEKPGVDMYNACAVFITGEEVRGKITRLIENCPHGDELVKRLKITVRKKRKKALAFTEAA